MSEKDSCPLCGLWPHAARCPAQVIEYAPVTGEYVHQGRVYTAGYDEPYPFNLSRYLWLMSGLSQQCYEAGVLGFGHN